jgi:polysaccharide chain length determinant protein (PEP-CTERM system associated)
MDQLLRQILTELRGAWRFRWTAMIVTWLIGVGGIAYVLTLPDLYEARAQVFVDTRDPLVAESRGGAEDAAMKVAYVRRMLLSTPNLEGVARQTDLDLRAPNPQAFQALVAGLQTAIQVAPGGGRGFEANVYSIVYRDTDRRTAERVVQVLLNSFQEQSLEGNLRDDIQALAFLDNQMTEYRRRLEEAEARVADFRRRNAGMVGGEGGFFVRLEGFEEELRQVRASLQIALEKRAALAAQFAGADGGTTDESGATSLAELESQVLQTEKRLDELRLIYTEEHPSVISATETLATLTARLAKRRDELGPLLGSGGAGGAVVENVRIAMSQVEIEITELRGRERDLRQRIAEQQQRVDIAPQLEAELAGLNRDHAVLRNQYENLLQRRELLSFDIDRKRQGRQLEFRIIEPPLAPQSPVAPDRFRLMLMVLAAALAAGGGVAFVLHQMKPVFVTGEMVYQQLGIPVLGAVSMAWTTRATWRRRRAEVLFGVGLVALLGIFGVVFAALPQMTALAQQWLA